MTNALLEVDASTCVACGLCLPHCPTYRATGMEPTSPRGRIAAIRAVQLEQAPMDDSFVDSIMSCVGCGACEVSCPGSVPFGRLIEAARSSVVAADRSGRRWAAIARGVRWLRLLRILLFVVAVGQRAGLGRHRLPRVPIARSRFGATGGDAWLFSGCGETLQPGVGPAAARVLDRAGVGVARAPVSGCCGAVVRHTGDVDGARRRAEHLVRRMTGDRPIIVTAAPCTAEMRGFGEQLDTDAARAFSRRIIDVHEVLAERPAGPVSRRLDPVALHEGCHSRNLAGTSAAVRAALEPFADIRELDPAATCCGAGGLFWLRRSRLARDVRARTAAAIRATGATTVVTTSPGCSGWLAAAGFDVLHTVELLDRVLGNQKGPAMPWNEFDDDRPHRVVLNDEEQYSIWPSNLSLPAGWREEGTEGTKPECLARIEVVWTDMRPLSLRNRMAGADS